MPPTPLRGTSRPEVCRPWLGVQICTLTHPPRDRGDCVEAGPSLLVWPTEAVHPGHDGVRLSRHPNTEPPVPGLWSRQALGVGPSV